MSYLLYQNYQRINSFLSSQLFHYDIISITIFHVTNFHVKYFHFFPTVIFDNNAHVHYQYVRIYDVYFVYFVCFTSDNYDNTDVRMYIFCHKKLFAMYLSSTLYHSNIFFKILNCFNPSP